MVVNPAATHNAVWAVVLYYRNWPDVLDTLSSLELNADGLAGVLVVDNASRDGLAERLAPNSSRMVHTLEENLGYAAGMNQGARVATDRGATHLLFMTHDCLLPAGAVTQLVATLQDYPAAGVVGPLLRFVESELVFSAGGFLDVPALNRHHLLHLAPLDCLSEGVASVDWLDGACLLVRRAAWDAVGPFDEDYFLYVEEVDLCLRMRQAGWTVLSDRSVTVAQSTNGMPAYFEARNWARFARLYAPSRTLWTFIAGQLVRVSKDLVKGEWAQAVSRAKGIRDHGMRRYGKPR